MEYKLTTIREIIGDVLCEQGRKILISMSLIVT